MENKSNRYFYDDNIDEKDYIKNKKNYIRFLVRCFPEHFENIKKEFPNIGFAKKSDTDRDKVNHYDFDIIKYDNSKSKDIICHHCVIICNDENIDDVKEKIMKTSDYVKFKNNGRAITVSLFESKSTRGIWTTDVHDQTEYPLCILSFNRADENGKTHKLLTKLGLNHYLFIEPSQKKMYENWMVHHYCKLIIYPENFSMMSMGGTPGRNYILDWAQQQGYDRVWMLDDNIKEYRRLQFGTKNIIQSSEIFTHIERYIKRFNNIGGVAHNFAPFIVEGDKRPCIIENCKIYSSMCLLTNPDIRFRYKYNEDVLISMEYIEKGYTTLCFNSVLYSKNTSGLDQGGNTTSIYKNGSGYKDKFEYLQCIVKILIIENKLTLCQDKTCDDLVRRDTTMKSKDYHHKVQYECLQNYHKNKIVKKENYNEIKFKNQKSVEWTLNQN